MRKFGIDWFKDPRKRYRPWWEGYAKWDDFVEARDGIRVAPRRSWL